jgi:hypothetical protein
VGSERALDGPGAGARRGPGGKHARWAAGALARLGGGAAWEGGLKASSFVYYPYFFFLLGI